MTAHFHEAWGTAASSVGDLPSGRRLPMGAVFYLYSNKKVICCRWPLNSRLLTFDKPELATWYQMSAGKYVLYLNNSCFQCFRDHVTTPYCFLIRELVFLSMHHNKLQHREKIENLIASTRILLFPNKSLWYCISYCLVAAPKYLAMSLIPGSRKRWILSLRSPCSILQIPGQSGLHSETSISKNNMRKAA